MLEIRQFLTRIADLLLCKQVAHIYATRTMKLYNSTSEIELEFYYFLLQALSEIVPVLFFHTIDNLSGGQSVRRTTPTTKRKAISSKRKAISSKVTLIYHRLDKLDLSDSPVRGASLNDLEHFLNCKSLLDNDCHEELNFLPYNKAQQVCVASSGCIGNSVGVVLASRLNEQLGLQLRRCIEDGTFSQTLRIVLSSHVSRRLRMPHVKLSADSPDHKRATCTIIAGTESVTKSNLNGSSAGGKSVES